MAMDAVTLLTYNVLKFAFPIRANIKLESRLLAVSTVTSQTAE